MTPTERAEEIVEAFSGQTFSGRQGEFWLITVIAAALTEARAEGDRMKKALESIASNTCCDKCQEAALVAKKALVPEEK